LVDTSTTDTDVLNASVVSASLAPRVQYIETLNVTGAYATTGLDLGNVTGTDDLNLATSVASGTATVTNANTLNAANINVGANVRTVSVTSSGSGTRDSVNVNMGSASVATITGNAGGADSYTVSAASGSTITLATVGSADDVTLKTTGTLALTGVAALGDLTIDASDALTVTVTTALADNTIVEGAGNVTIRGGRAILDGLSLENDNAGTVTFRQTDATATADYDEVVADVLELTTAAAAAATVSVNEATTVNLDEDITFAGDVTIDVDNTDGDLAADAGTLILQVSESQDVAGSSITTGVGVGTLILEATPDESADTASSARITIVEVDTFANTTSTIVAQGSAALEIDLLTNAASTVISATAMTGMLKIDATTATSTIYLGAGNDDITAGAFATTMYGNDGDDTLDGGNAGQTIYGGNGNDSIGGGSGTASLLAGDAGNDTITGGSAADTITGGDGNDLIIGGGGSDTITAGSGSDTIRMGAQTGVVVSDFSIGTDMLVLTGTSTINGTFDLADVDPTDGLYSFSSTHTVTLTGNTASDLSGSVTLGRAGTAFVVLGGTNLTSGSGADVISMAVTSATSSTINGGSGDDTITLTGAATMASGGVTITGGSGDDTITLQSNEGEAVRVNVGSGADNLILGSTSTGVATIQWAANGFDSTQTIVQFDTTEDKLSFDGIVTGLTATSGTGITAGTTAAAALTDDRVYVVTSGATAPAGGSTETVTNYLDLSDVAAYLDDQFTSTASGDVAVFVINDTIGLKSYVYLFQESATAASTISAAELKLIGVVTEESGGALVLGDIA
jgi:RTX calcium-binding nonapeptide repeat (4 copies)